MPEILFSQAGIFFLKSFLNFLVKNSTDKSKPCMAPNTINVQLAPCQNPNIIKVVNDA